VRCGAAGVFNVIFEETSVSDDPNHGATEIRATKGGGGGGKWLLGGLAAVVLLGGGYFAWKSTQPTNQTDLETAYNDTYEADQVRAGPMGSSDDPTADTASDDSAPSVAASSAARSSSTPRRTTTASADAVPEETLGVMPVNASSDDVATIENTDDIVVTAPPRPVWARTPSQRRLAEFYPDRALQRGREGEARLHCTVLDGGALDCAKISETPGGGFGNAALRMSRSLRHAAVRRDGADATGTPVNLRVVFRIEDDRRG
jgi:TonB family protein